ncbi:MAG: hypothetical protein GY909_15085 [Oligoflexia bacterium]|nr:hypothetical protein [Oligoflexia bacterium]
MSELAPHKFMIDEYKGNKIVKIYKVDEEGNELEKYGTIVSFGLTKAKYILEHIDEIKEFVESQSN